MHDTLGTGTHPIIRSTLPWFLCLVPAFGKAAQDQELSLQIKPEMLTPGRTSQAALKTPVKTREDFNLDAGDLGEGEPFLGCGCR